METEESLRKTFSGYIHKLLAVGNFIGQLREERENRRIGRRNKVKVQKLRKKRKEPILPSPWFLSLSLRVRPAQESKKKKRKEKAARAQWSRGKRACQWVSAAGVRIACAGRS